MRPGVGSEHAPGSLQDGLWPNWGGWGKTFAQPGVQTAWAWAAVQPPSPSLPLTFHLPCVPAWPPLTKPLRKSRCCEACMCGVSSHHRTLRKHNSDVP